MINTNGDDRPMAVGLEEPKPDVQESTPAAPPPPGVRHSVATRANLRAPQPLGQNKVVLIAGGAVVVALLLFVFSSAPSSKGNPTKARATAGRQAEPPKPDENPDEQKSLFPVIESGKPRAKVTDSSMLAEQDVERTATPQPLINRTVPQPKTPASGTLGSIPPFDNPGTWQAPPYQPANAAESIAELNKGERNQASLVFVQKVTQSVPTNVGDRPIVDPGSWLGLPTGTRLRARLESAASTAVKAPVIAVIEYNYEKNGEIVVQAGTKVFGHVEQADRSGYMSIRFDSLLMPDGSSTALDAIATNLSLGPLRGRVEGKNSAKNALVRSFSGIGQVAALLAGRNGSVNQPFSEADVIRERISTNIGESADQAVRRLAVTERVVVTISANTPVYVVLDRGVKQTTDELQSPRTPPGNSTNSTESLRQLLQLQRELNQGSELSSH